MPEIRSEVPLLVAFADLTRFGAQSQRVSDVDLADVLDAYYERLAAAVEGAGGRLVKFIGDGAVVVFGEDEVDRGVQALLELKESVDSFMGGEGLGVSPRHQGPLRHRRRWPLRIGGRQALRRDRQDRQYCGDARFDRGHLVGGCLPQAQP